ncbi:MAG: acetylxylan esterase [Pseudomonadota bacterium]
MLQRINRQIVFSHVSMVLGLCAAFTAHSQAPAPATAAPAAQAPRPPNPGQQATTDDHRQMQQQLGITRLRPGPSGNVGQPNQANYDEALANPFPNLPEVLKFENGSKVTSAKQWREQRRPEIIELFEREVLGRTPKNVPKVAWSVTETATAKVGAHEVNAKHLQGKVDNSAYPEIEVNIDVILVTPANAKGPVPVMIMFGGGRMPGAAPPAGGPGGPGGPPRPAAPAGAAAAAPAAPRDPPNTEQLLAAGWGYAYLNPGSVQADNGGGLTKGIIGLTNKGKNRKPDDWGSLRAWGWGASQALDYFETEKSVDAKRVGIEGVSRYGKAALVTMAFDERFAVVLIGSSGEGGAKLHRRNFGETVENLTGSGEYHWMAGNFLKYGTEEGSLGKRTAGDIPVDAHELLALCAPRATFVSYGVPEQGDANWLDQRGSYMAALAAGPVFRLLGVKDLGRGDYDTNPKMPAVNESVLDGKLAWRQHDGGHTDGPNWKYFIPWANRELGIK